MLLQQSMYFYMICSYTHAVSMYTYIYIYNACVYIYTYYIHNEYMYDLCVCVCIYAVNAYTHVYIHMCCLFIYTPRKKQRARERPSKKEAGPFMSLHVAWAQSALPSQASNAGAVCEIAGSHGLRLSPRNDKTGAEDLGLRAE